MSLLSLFFTFFYIGLFTIGGGVVALTLMEQTIVAKGLITTEQFYNMVAISESTPGPLGTNMATYIGYNLYGIPGGIVCTMGEVLPSVIIIVIIAHFLKKFNDNVFVKGSLAFLRPISTGLILVPAVKIFIHAILILPQSASMLTSWQTWKEMIQWVNLCAYSIFLFLLLKYKLHPILIILGGAVFGLYFM